MDTKNYGRSEIRARFFMFPFSSFFFFIIKSDRVTLLFRSGCSK